MPIKVKLFCPAEKGLDLEHSTMAIKSLAKFHALGIVAKIRYPVEFESLKSKSIEAGFNYRAMDALYRNCTESIIRHPRFRAYAPFVEALAARRRAGRFDLVTREPWATIVHNDFWTNNIMFRKNGKGQVDALKFFDFQTYCFANVFIDLTYFLCTSLSDRVRQRYFDELLDVYYKTFLCILKKLKIDVEEFSRSKFDQQFKRDAGNDFLHCAVAFKFFTTDAVNRDEADRANLMSDIMSCEGNDLYYEKLAQLLTIYEERDWLH